MVIPGTDIYDPQTKLVRFGARDYDPQIGRWTARDPILFEGAYRNLYSYSFDDPVNFLDPEGELVPLIVAGALVGGFIGGGSYALFSWASGGEFHWSAFGCAVAAGALAGGVGVVAAPIATALGLGHGMAGIAAVNAASGLIQGGILAATDPCVNLSPELALSSTFFGAAGGFLGGKWFPTKGMVNFRQVGFPRTIRGVVPRALGGVAGPNATNALYRGGLMSLGVGTVGPYLVN